MPMRVVIPHNYYKLVVKLKRVAVIGCRYTQNTCLVYTYLTFGFNDLAKRVEEIHTDFVSMVFEDIWLEAMINVVGE